MTLEDKLAPLRLRYKKAKTDLEKKMILKAVEQFKREHGVSKRRGLWDDTFEMARKVFG